MRETIPLHTERGGPPFASVVESARARLAIDVAPTAGPGAMLEVESGGLTVRGTVDPKTFHVHPSHALALAGWYVPGDVKALAVERSAKGTLGVSATAEAPVELKGLLEDDVACADVTLEETPFARESVVPNPSSPRSQVIFKPGAAPLSVAEGGLPVALIHVAAGESLTAQVFMHGKTEDRVVLALTRDLVFGWVPRASVSPTLIGVGRGDGFASDGVRVRRKRLRSDACARSTDVIAEVAGGRRVVGTVAPGASIDVIEERGPFVVVDFWASNIHPEQGVNWLIDERAGACQPVVDPPK